MRIENAFKQDGPVISDHILDKFFSHYYTTLMSESLKLEKSGQRKEEKYSLSVAADMIGRRSTDLTNAQKSTRRDIKIIFEAAFISNVKLVLSKRSSLKISSLFSMSPLSRYKCRFDAGVYCMGGGAKIKSCGCVCHHIEFCH